MLDVGILIVAACLPFKPCSTPSPVTPIGSLSGKKRRVTPSNGGVRCAAKNTKVEMKKMTDKLAASPSDDKVVSSSCEVDCSNAVSPSVTPKSIPSRSSLDNFVHSTQKLEVTTSSTDGDLVDLTAEDENASEAAGLSSTCLPTAADSDVMLTAVTEGDVMKPSEPFAAESDVTTVKPFTCTPVEEPAKTEKASDETKKDCRVNDTEVAAVSQQDAGKTSTPATGSISWASATVQLPDGKLNVQEVDGLVDAKAISSLDGQNASNVDPVARSTVDFVGESPSDRSGSHDEDNDDVEMEQSPTHDIADEKLSHATVVLVKLNEETLNTANCVEKSEVSASCAHANSNANKETGHVDQKPKVR